MLMDILSLICSFLGGIAIGLSYYFVVVYVVDRNILVAGPKQWPIILFGGIAGLVGSIIDSLLGATVQYSGLDENGRVVEHPGTNVKHISGYRLLDNHSVNLISSILTALIMPFIAMKFWILWKIITHDVMDIANISLNGFNRFMIFTI